jgi:uncharacterized protein with HEPN domain
MSKSLYRLKTILKKIDFIENIIKEKGISSALDDEQNTRASLMMHLTSIAEQFDKLSKDGEFQLLAQFDKEDIRGSYDVRNYIAHDYEGINLSVIEAVIRQKIPKLKENILQILTVNQEGTQS